MKFVWLFGICFVTWNYVVTCFVDFSLRIFTNVISSLLF